MPNWCDNSVTFKHADSAAIDRICAVDTTDKGQQGLFATFFPCPQELCIDVQLGTTDESLLAVYAARWLAADSVRRQQKTL